MPAPDGASVRRGLRAGVEGLAAYLPQQTDRWPDPTARDRILWAARSVESEPSLLGRSPHLLLVAVAP